MNVLPFPQTELALQRYSTSMGAAGLLALMLLERDNQPIPANVQRFDMHGEPAMPSQTPELAFALLLWNELPPTKKASFKKSLRDMAYSPRAGASVVQLHNLLNPPRQA
jgi:hypothetical protein